ncbi:MAG: TIM barrel protein [Bacillota bacterium]
MKTTITGFLDLEGKATIEQQIECITKHELSSICLRKYNQNPLIGMSEGEIKNLISLLKDAKLKISILDTGIVPYSINDDRKHSVAFDEFKYMIKLADRLKVQYLYYRLPIFDDVIEEYENIAKRLEPFVDAAMKSSKKIILLPNNNYKSNVYAYIMKKLKSNVISIAFDPVYIMMNNESTTTAYRLLKKSIGSFSATDADHQNMPKLIGYGKTDIVSLFKKLLRDHYDGFLLIDNRFQEEVFEIETQKTGFFAKLFKTKEKKKETMLADLSSKIFPNEETKNVTYNDILANQIKVLKIIFK